MLKSFYTLEIYVQPGGARGADLFISNSIEEIKGVLRATLSSNHVHTYLLDYGEDIRFSVYQNGGMVSHTNLLPYLSIEVAEQIIFTIDENLKITPDLKEISFSDNADLKNVSVFIDWSSLEIPVLKEPLLMPDTNEAILVNDSYYDSIVTPEDFIMLGKTFERIKETQDKLKKSNDPHELDDLESELEDIQIELEELGVAYYGRNDREFGEPREPITNYIDIDENSNAKVYFSFNAKAYYNRANLKRSNLNDLEGTLADYSRAILCEPTFSKAYINRGNLKYNKLGDIEGALFDYNQAIFLNSQDAVTYYNRALLKKNKLNDNEGAIEDLHQAEQLFREQGQIQASQRAIKMLQQLGAAE